jgi:hypothetical protein
VTNSREGVVIQLGIRGKCYNSSAKKIGALQNISLSTHLQIYALHIFVPVKHTFLKYGAGGGRKRSVGLIM